MEYREPHTQNTTAGQKSLVLNPTIAEPVAPEIESDPEVITLAISEVDRQTAGPYTDIHNCLICTTLRNRGYNVHSVGPTVACLASASDDWIIEGVGGLPSDLKVRHCFFFPDVAPFYRKRVVGKVIRLRKVR